MVDFAAKHIGLAKTLAISNYLGFLAFGVSTRISDICQKVELKKSVKEGDDLSPPSIVGLVSGTIYRKNPIFFEKIYGFRKVFPQTNPLIVAFTLW